MKILSQLSHESRIVERGWLIKTIHLERLQSDKWVSVESVMKTNEVFYSTDDYVRLLLYKEHLKLA
jgi:hypothetical protein